MNIGYLVSGNLGLVTLQKLSREFPPAFVITDKGSTAVTAFCESAGWKVFVGKPAGDRFNSFKSKIKQPDLLVSINFIFLLGPDVLQWPTKSAINIHGSLLPKYRGRAPHIWAIINGESESGLTVHLIDQECDTGSILYQEIIPIGPTMTGGDLLKVFEQRYPEVLKFTISDYLSGKTHPQPQDNSKSSYFGKRTPEDGGINWSWDYNRLHNWVRALAPPYPGAFSFIEKEKIIIMEVERSSEDLLPYEHFEVGQIVRIHQGLLLIKGMDAVIQVNKFSFPRLDDLKVGVKLILHPPH